LQDVDASRSTVLDTQAVLRLVQDAALNRAQTLDAAQLEFWRHVGSKADIVENTLDNVNADLPGLVKTLESMMEQFRNSTENLSGLHGELEEQIIRNNEQLLLQQSFISRMKLSSFAELCQYAGLLLFVLVANSVHPWLVSLGAVLICKSRCPFASVTQNSLCLVLYALLQAISSLPLVSVAPFPLPSLPSIPSYNFASHHFYVQLFSGCMAILGITFMLGLLVVFLRNVYVASRKQNVILRMKNWRQGNIDEQSLEVEKPSKQRKVVSSSHDGNLPTASQRVEEHHLFLRMEEAPTTQVHDTCHYRPQHQKKSRSFSVNSNSRTDANDRYRRAQSEPALDLGRYAVRSFD
jgi:hypothetical protein